MQMLMEGITDACNVNEYNNSESVNHAARKYRSWICGRRQVRAMIMSIMAVNSAARKYRGDMKNHADNEKCSKETEDMKNYDDKGKRAEKESSPTPTNAM